MRALNKNEIDFVDMLLSDETTLINFFRETDSPLFIKILLGNNLQGRNVFEEGCTPVSKGRSRFSWPALYLRRVVERLKKENISTKAKDEYCTFVVEAVEVIMREALSEKGPKDGFMVSQLIETLDVIGPNYWSGNTENLINDYILRGFSGEIIITLLPLVKKLLQRQDPRSVSFVLSLLDVIPLSDEYRSIYSYLRDFLNDQTVISSFARLCGEGSIIQVAQKLKTRMQLDVKHLISNKIEMVILPDAAIRVTILNSGISFILPDLPFDEKEVKIRPIIEDNLRKYAESDKSQIIELIFHFYTFVWQDLTYITYPSLWKPLQDSPSRPSEQILIYVLKEILKLFLQEQGREKFQALYQQIIKTDKHFILKRILLYCYAENFQQCRQDIWALLQREKGLLFSINFEAEIYGLFNHNVSQFTPEEIEWVDTLIENGPYDEVGWLDAEVASGYNSEKYKLMWKQEKYAPLRDNSTFQSKYVALYTKTRQKEFLNFRDGYKARFLSYRPVSTDEKALEVLAVEPEVFVRNIGQFEQQNPFHRFTFVDEKPSIEGNIEQMRRLGRNFPKEITTVIVKFLPLKTAYIRNILYGLGETPNRQDIAWGNLFKFIKNYLAHFPEDNLTEEQVSSSFVLPKEEERVYIMRAFAGVIPESDEMPEENLMQAIDILEEFLKVLLPQYHFAWPFSEVDKKREELPSYLDTSIGTAVGNIVEKYISLCLKQGKKTAYRLQTMMDFLFTKQLIEAYVFFGLYFAYFQDILKDWTQKVAHDLLAKRQNNDKDQTWEVFFEGFIKSRRQYFEYYDEMYPHYQQAIELYSGNRHEALSHMLIQFLLEGKDSLKGNSLLLYCYDKHAFQILASGIYILSHKTNKRIFFDEPLTEQAQQEEIRAIKAAKHLWIVLRERMRENSQWDLVFHEGYDYFLKSLLSLMTILDKVECADYNLIRLLIDNSNPKDGDRSEWFKYLLHVLHKQREDSGIFYCAKIYKTLIKDLDHIFFPREHEQIIKMLVSRKENSAIQNRLDSIKCIYITKHWNEGLPWFEGDIVK